MDSSCRSSGLIRRQTTSRWSWKAAGARVFPAVPDQSLLLQKSVAACRTAVASVSRRLVLNTSTIRDWIASGMRFGTKDDPEL